MSNMLWSGLFEDVYLQHFPYNLNQYSPMETARYLLEHPELDPEWKNHVQELIRFVERTFVVDTRAFSPTAPPGTGCAVGRQHGLGTDHGHEQDGEPHLAVRLGLGVVV